MGIISEAGIIRLIDPKSRKELHLKEGGLYDIDGQLYPRVNGVYRLVDSNNYTANFGFQWNAFRETQIDKVQKGQQQSRERLLTETDWKEELAGLNVLEVGSGAGRFTQIILEETKANLYSLDYSGAVDANYENNGTDHRLKLFQASIYEMPFSPHQFDKVICLGVLQHTPDFKKSVACLCEMVKPGGELVVDFYEQRGWYTKIHAKYLFRPFTKRMEEEKLLRLIEDNVGWLIRLYKLLYRLKLGAFTRFLPICDINRTVPQGLSSQTFKEWVILDTFDMFSPEFDNPHRISDVAQMVERNGMVVTKQGHVYFSDNKAAVVRARRAEEVT